VLYSVSIAAFQFSSFMAYEREVGIEADLRVCKVYFGLGLNIPCVALVICLATLDSSTSHCSSAPVV
jgi:hypothetical protein